MMFIFWGTKSVEKYLGRVADFCPICHEARTFKIFKIGRASHVYGISMGDGSFVCNQITCEECGVKLNADANDYTSISGKQNAQLNEIVYDTHPNITERRAARLFLEEKIRTRALSADQRVQLIREPLILHNWIVEKETEGIQYTLRGTLGCIVFVVSFISLSIYVGGPKTSPFVTGTLLAVTISSLVLAIYDACTRPNKILKTRVIPKIALGLKPIQPSLSELEDELKFLKKAGYAVGKKIKAKIVYDLL